ncbi:pyrroloquinoline quinone biosynthesis protein PqqB [Erythrobacter sp. KY5]|uniref:MBL fold metallo-hydrolase n=1 Tax=Erythrobacter sp. KY5 TaxID=2011159 RepID=UPI000DBEF506|nr:MBL fold metallo-hydrolase [Erythrobacter sp. KY5]AWW75710.1 pyrroloquinoline quinone biosynthesis protein PqqB [Erythrobacter sp. KY5]
MITMGPLLALLLAGEAVKEPPSCDLELVVLGAGQDAGAPQLGNPSDDGPHLLPTSLGLIDRDGRKRFLFEATPAITQQVHALDRVEPGRDDAPGGLGLDGVFLTHAHIGHYLGLAQFGVESAGADGQRVFAMERMAQFLRRNGPWSQLVELGNIEIIELVEGERARVSDTLTVEPMRMPHRDEFSETVGYLLTTPGKSAVFIPDLDSWEEWEEMSGDSLEALVSRVDFAFVDATFFDDDELPGRDMSAIPHPRVVHTMKRLSHLPEAERAKVHFIHYNHTNPIRDPGSAQSLMVADKSFAIARRGDRHCLVEGG